MRYVFKEPIISTISDDDLTDDKAIRDLLISLKQMQHNVYMEYRDPEFPDMIKKLDNVRIIEVRENNIDIHAFFSRASAKMKNIPFHNIDRIQLIASKQLISQKYRVNRWHLMDIAEISEET